MPPPDDLNEQLSWLRVYGENVGMASHDQDDFSWHAFPEGDYRVAIDDSYAEHCASADQTSALCRDGEDGWALCINSSDGDILPLAEAACDRLE